MRHHDIEMQTHEQPPKKLPVIMVIALMVVVVAYASASAVATREVFAAAGANYALTLSYALGIFGGACITALT